MGRTYQLQLTDFQSQATQSGTWNITQYPYCFKPWFWIHHKQYSVPIKKVNCSVQRDAASLIAPDTIKANKLLQFASYEFDLSELYARKLQEIYEQKGSFKGTYTTNQKKFIEEHAMASKNN
jgi:hypothetical protein